MHQRHFANSASAWFYRISNAPSSNKLTGKQSGCERHYTLPLTQARKHTCECATTITTWLRTGADEATEATPTAWSSPDIDRPHTTRSCREPPIRKRSNPLPQPSPHPSASSGYRISRYYVTNTIASSDTPTNYPRQEENAGPLQPHSIHMRLRVDAEDFGSRESSQYVARTFPPRGAWLPDWCKERLAWKGS